MVISDVECVERVEPRKCMFFLNQKLSVFDVCFFQLLTTAQSGRDRLQEKMAVVRKNPKDIHDLFSRIPAFTLQSYCAFRTCKAVHSCYGKFSIPCGVVIPQQALLTVLTVALCRQCKGDRSENKINDV